MCIPLNQSRRTVPEYRDDERKKHKLLHDRHGMVVGGLEGVKYHDYEILLEPGDKIFVYTDGLKEAADPRPSAHL